PWSSIRPSENPSKKWDSDVPVPPVSGLSVIERPGSAPIGLQSPPKAGRVRARLAQQTVRAKVARRTAIRHPPRRMAVFVRTGATGRRQPAVGAPFVGGAGAGGGAGRGCWGEAEATGWRASSQSIRGGKISRGAYRLQTRSQWP